MQRNWCQLQKLIAAPDSYLLTFRSACWRHYRMLRKTIISSIMLRFQKFHRWLLYLKPLLLEVLLCRHQWAHSSKVKCCSGFLSVEEHLLNTCHWMYVCSAQGRQSSLLSLSTVCSLTTEMTYYVSSGTLNSTNSTQLHNLLHMAQYVSLCSLGAIWNINSKLPCTPLYATKLCYVGTLFVDRTWMFWLLNACCKMFTCCHISVELVTFTRRYWLLSEWLWRVIDLYVSQGWKRWFFEVLVFWGFGFFGF